MPNPCHVHHAIVTWFNTVFTSALSTQTMSNRPYVAVEPKLHLTDDEAELKSYIPDAAVLDKKGCPLIIFEVANTQPSADISKKVRDVWMKISPLLGIVIVKLHGKTYRAPTKKISFSPVVTEDQWFKMAWPYLLY
jgi:hypothetical protein